MASANLGAARSPGCRWPRIFLIALVSPAWQFDAIDLIGHGLQERFEQFPLSLDAPLVDHAHDEFFG